MPELTIRLLRVDELPLILPLMLQHNPKLTPAVLDSRLTEMLAQGYRCVGVFEERELIGVAGVWLITRFWCGRSLDVDNVFVLPSRRNAGVGQKLMDWIHDYAKELGCDVAVLDSYVTLHDAHRFYIRDGYQIRGYHFVKELKETR